MQRVYQLPNGSSAFSGLRQGKASKELIDAHIQYQADQLASLMGKPRPKATPRRWGALASTTK